LSRTAGLQAPLWNQCALNGREIFKIWFTPLAYFKDSLKAVIKKKTVYMMVK